MSDTYGPGGRPPQVTASGQSILDRGYGAHLAPQVKVTMPTTVPVTSYDSPAPTPAGVGPSSVNPPGPLGPLSRPQGPGGASTF